MFKEISAFVMVVIIGLAAVFGLTFLGYKSYEFFAPKYRAVDNKVYHESEQYNEGMVRDLENLQLEYINATPEGKQSLRAIVLHRFSVYPEDKLPPNLRNFYNDLKAGK